MTIGSQLGFPEPVDTSVAWRDQANCRAADPEQFFPVGDTGPAVEAIRRAKAVCRTCPVVDACLHYALETKQVDGIWGGTTEDERRRIRRAWLATRRLRAG